MGYRLVAYCDICKKDLDLDNGYALRICKMSDIEKLYSQEEHNNHTKYYDLCFDCMLKVSSFIANEMED